MSLRLEGVTKTVAQEPYLYPLDMQLEPGRIHVLLGPTQAGKTSLLRLMAGLDSPSSGRVWWQNEDVTGWSVQRRQVAMVYQRFINYPNLTVYENIASPLRLAGKRDSAIKKQVLDAADMLHITDLLQRRPLQLSGGQQQRVALARALVKKASLVLLDEPLANLDYKLREELRSELPKLFLNSAAILVYATTEPSEALLLGGYTATLWQGRVTHFGESAAVYQRPKDRITAQIFSDPPMNFFSLEKSASHLLFADQRWAVQEERIAALPDGHYQAGLHPHHLRLAKSAGDLLFSGPIISAEFSGSESFFHFRYQQQRWIALCHGIHARDSESVLTVYANPQQLHLFDMQGTLLLSPHTRHTSWPQ